DLMEALVDCYFTRRIKAAWDRPWAGSFEPLEKFAKDFDVDGVIWYETIYRDGPDLQAWAFAKKFKAAGQSFVKIETDYTAAELGTMRTRIETFIELME
ncbi:MAG: 2-hydroxyacyl-CoA dehydratase, partial [Coriobacteriales bacterium]|nr:2-hydroxyacyl-CoA dehydratase [Coriobacteriales bacterium]